jgi:hypothetical protein
VSKLSDALADLEGMVDAAQNHLNSEDAYQESMEYGYLVELIEAAKGVLGAWS